VIDMSDQDPVIDELADEATIPSISADTIVVGHDGSSAAHHALTTALDLADQLRAPVLIVRAWSFATAPRPQDWTFGYVSSSDDVQQAVQDALMSDVQHVVERFDRVQVAYRAIHAGPARSLIELSATARMVVVGSRGLGGVAQVILGSVSDEVINNARCPVLVTSPKS
jgi:nucleotide-binding universal stress UspA family protein